MNAVAKRHVPVESALDVESVGVGILAFISTRAAGEKDQLRELRNGAIVPHDITSHETGLNRGWCLKTEQLLNGVRHQVRPRQEFRTLTGVTGEQDRGPTKQSRCRLATCQLQKREESEHL